MPHSRNMPPISMNPLAHTLNQSLQSQSPPVFDFLSPLGKSLYFPRGILYQSAEAKEKAHRFDATIGIATDSSGPLGLPSFDKYFRDLRSDEIYPYSSSFGLPGLRAAWKDRLVRLNPSLSGKSFSLPVVTSGLTHGLSLCEEMFLYPGQVLILPDQIWGNYRLIFAVKGGVALKTFPFFRDDHFNLEGIESLMQKEASEKGRVNLLLNSPNNPTGYALTRSDVEKLLELFRRQLEKGIRLFVILDDAYFGLFYEDDAYPESLFASLSDLHPHLLVVKLDGLTKEYFAWGFRIGFMTLGHPTLDAEGFACLEKKVAGAIRGSVSNCSTPAQHIALRELNSDLVQEDCRANHAILKGRAQKVKAVLADGRYRDEFIPYPFNAGYFMLIRLVNIDAERLRVHLLERYGVGTVSTSKVDLRVAFSCVEEKDIPEIFGLIYRGCKDLR